jgi:hypothetical protein
VHFDATSYTIGVHLPRDDRFDEEAARFGLAFTCDECGHFDRAADACAHEWPTGLHRRERYRERAAEVVFCKEFEAK